MGEMDYNAVVEIDARAESIEYGVAGAVLTAVEQAGFTPNGTDFAARVEQRKELLGRVIVILSDYQGTRATQPATAPGDLVADLQRELAFYFGAYHDQMGHNLDAAHCRENECERIKKLLYTIPAPDVAERARRAARALLMGDCLAPRNDALRLSEVMQEVADIIANEMAK